MIIGVGIDVCDVDRFAESIERRPGLVQRLFTPAEAERPMASKAARFAAKEALAKALGAPDGMSWLDAEVVTDDHGQPVVQDHAARSPLGPPSLASAPSTSACPTMQASPRPS